MKQALFGFETALQNQKEKKNKPSNLTNQNKGFQRSAHTGTREIPDLESTEKKLPAPTASCSEWGFPEQ